MMPTMFNINPSAMSILTEAQGKALKELAGRYDECEEVHVNMGFALPEGYVHFILYGPNSRIILDGGISAEGRVST